MLRQKMLIILGSMVALLLVAAIGAVLLLQDVLNDLDHVTTVAISGATQTSHMAATITRVEVELNEVQLNPSAHLDGLIDAVEMLERQAVDLGEFYVMREEGNSAEAYQQLREEIGVFIRHVGNLATTRDPDLARRHTERALNASVLIREGIATLGQIAQDHSTSEQHQVTTKFRWMVLGVSLVFLLVINFSILMVLRAVMMILKPVDRLVEASRCLAREEFDHRVDIDQHDEFDELGRAHNRLAAQLQSNEQRKMETLQQVARTLNHELNNAISIIDLQLSLMARRSEGDQALAKPLHQIQETLGRMSRTVDALKHIRRIVLTDYLEGVQMLDLKRSVEDGPVEPPPRSPVPGEAEAS